MLFYYAGLAVTQNKSGKAVEIMDTLFSHSSYLLKHLQEQRIQGLLCDCMLVVKGVCFKAHKNVLAAFSSYFRSLFQNSPSQKNEVFHLVIQDVGGIGQILDYMYTSNLDVNHDNVQALLDIAQCLQVPKVQSLCNSFLKPYSRPAENSPSFSLPGVQTSENDWLVGNTLPQDDLHCSSSEAHKTGCTNGDLNQTRKPFFPITPHNSISSTTCGSSQAPQEKQLFHGYKLRNFYSKQYFKESAAQSNNAALNQGLSHLVIDKKQLLHPGVTQPSSNFSVCADNILQTSPPCPAIPVEKNMNSMLHEDTLTILSSDDSTLKKPVRPKKAVYLKKYNYLRSQRALEEMCVKSICEPILTCPKVNQPEDSMVQKTVEISKDRLDKGNEEIMETVLDTNLSSSITTGKEESIQKMLPETSEVTGYKQYCCGVCCKVFKHPSNLELHKRSHTGEKPFRCNICGKNFSQAGNLQTHLRRHSGEKPYICELCGKSFAAAGDVQRHIVVHTGERPHLCDICGRGFSNFSNLKEHKKTHITDKTFTCDQCGKSFNMQRKLLKHKVRHAGEKPHRCDTCGKCFIGSGDLRRHMRSHTGERPYLCNNCGKSFTRSALMRRHCSMHCKGAPNTNPSADSSGQPTSSDEGAPFSKSLRHSKALPASVEQPLPTVVSDSPQEKPFSSPITLMETPLRPASTSEALPELRALAPHHLLSSSHQEKFPNPHPALDHLKSGKLLPQEIVYGPYMENGLETSGRQGGRSYIPQTDNHCGSLPASSKLIGAPYRPSEGPFFSSVTLWGLAMKTLQNDNDMEQ